MTKTIFVLAIATALIAGTLATGTLVSAQPDNIGNPFQLKAGAPIIFSSGNTPIDPTVPQILGQGNIVSTAGNNFVMPAAGVISDLRATSAGGPGAASSGETRTFTVKQSFGGPTGLECTQTEVSQTCFDNTSSFPVTPGKKIWIEVTSSAGANGAHVGASVLFTPS